MNSSLQKVAVITGSTQGIGKAIGCALLKEGCFVIFNYANSDDTAEQLDQELSKQYCGHYQIIKANLSSFDGVTKLINETLENHTAIDYLILNTGITNRNSFINITPDEWNLVIDTNLNMPFFIVQKYSKFIRQKGRIIFIGSIMGMYPHSLSIGYGVSKASIHMLSKYLVKEFAERNITVNTIVPGFVDTPWQKNKPEDIRRSIEGKIALGRFASPDEVADICISVLKNSYINGSEIVVDGGYSYK